jgi:hypothetical protein
MVAPPRIGEPRHLAFDRAGPSPALSRGLAWSKGRRSGWRPADPHPEWRREARSSPEAGWLPTMSRTAIGDLGYG